MGSRLSRHNSLEEEEEAAVMPCPKKGFRGREELPLQRRSPNFQLLKGPIRWPGVQDLDGPGSGY